MVQLRETNMKYCTKCGKPLIDDAVICPNCGCAVETNKSDETNGMSIAGFVCSFFIPLLGLIFGIIGYKKSKELDNGKGLSIAAIAVSTASFVLYLCLIKIILYTFL